MLSRYFVIHSRPYFGSFMEGTLLLFNLGGLQNNLCKNFGGFIPPSKLEDSYRLHRVNKAVQKMSETEDQDGESDDGERAGSLLRQNRFGDRSQVTGTIERMVEDMIHQSMEHGDFKDLPGMGKPLPPKEVSPYIDITQYNLNRVLKNNGAAPEFVTIDREVKTLLSESKSKLFRERFKLGLEPLSRFNQKKLDQLVMSFREEMKIINNKIVNFNMCAPSLRLQKFQLNPDREVEKVIAGYKEYEREMLLSREKRRNENAAANDEANGWSSMGQITEKLLSAILGHSNK